MHIDQIATRLGVLRHQNRSFQVKIVVQFSVNGKNIIPLQFSDNNRTTQIHTHISSESYFSTLLHFVEKSKTNLCLPVGLT